MVRDNALASAARDPLGYRPLYRQVRDVLVGRIADGAWQPGGILPSEPEIAADLGVSQGTVRKALDDMTAENLVVRRQGRGTFVARHDDERILFQFFRLGRDDGGDRQFPESRVIDVRLEQAEDADIRVLRATPPTKVVVIERVRSLDGIPCIVERIALPPRLFPAIEERELPNNLYDLYAREFGVTIVRASEQVKAVAAEARDAEHLGLPPGTPVLAVDRTAFAIDGSPVERRLSLCRTDNFHYACELR